jgi:hypothetical protein
MDDRARLVALQHHWDASDASDFEVEHEIYCEDAVLDYPQSGERIHGRRNIQESRIVQPNKKRFTVRRIIGGDDLWITEFVLTYDGIPLLCGEHHGIPRRSGGQRNAIFRQSVRPRALACASC